MNNLLKSFLKRQLPTWISFLYAYLFYLGFDMSGIGIKLTSRSEFLENSKEWFYIGCVSLIAIEIIYQIIKRDKTLQEYFLKEEIKSDDPKTSFNLCRLISIFSIIYFLLFAFNLIHDFYYIILSPFVIYGMYYCYKNRKLEK